MFRFKVGKWMRNSQCNNQCQHNIQRPTLPFPSLSHEFTNNGHSVSTIPFQLRNRSCEGTNMCCIAKRTFTRTSYRRHDIKCVTTTYYEDLGIPLSATSKEIKEAFYRLSKECHPDKVGPETPEALRQFQVISEAYATLSDPKLRRQYDRGVLGRMSSAADRDASKHKVTGDSFIQGRASFREEYGEGGTGLRRKERLDHYVANLKSKNFKTALAERTAQSHSVTNLDGSVRRIEPQRATRDPMKDSYTEWTEGKNQDTNTGGSGLFMFMITVTIVILIVRKLM